MIKVSVIVPVFNAHDYLSRCLDSLCNQTLKEIEVICVDDCSTDDSREILKRYADQYTCLKIICHTKNGGESSARNTGLKNAKGEYLGFVDNDDLVDLDFYEKLYLKAKEENAEIVKGELHEISYSKKDYYGNLNKKIRKYDSKLFFAYDWWTAIYKRCLVENNHITFIENHPLGGDVLFLNEAILKCQKLALVDDAFYHYYRREDSGDSKMLSWSKIVSVLDVHERMLDNVLASKIYETDRRGADFLFSWGLSAALNYAFRCRTEECLTYCLKKAFAFYRKLPFLPQQHDGLSPLYDIVIPYLKSDDYDGLLKLYYQYDNPKKMLLANLRYINQMRQNIKKDA